MPFPVKRKEEQSYKMLNFLKWGLFLVLFFGFFFLFLVGFFVFFVFCFCQQLVSKKFNRKRSFAL